jgi:acyl dehydratase
MSEGLRDPKGRAAVPFERIEPGDPLGEFSYELTPELVDRHLRATGQVPYADPTVAPISILAADGVNLADRFWDISQSVHAGQQLHVESLPRIGDRLTVRGRAREKFVRRGRRWVVSETVTENAAGETVASGLTTGVIVYSEADPAPEAGGDSGPRDSGTRAAESEPPVLEHLEPLTRTMTLDAMILYEPPGEVNMHTDDVAARAAGLPAAIATGTLFLAYVFDLLHRHYGSESLVGVELDVRIRTPVFAGDRIETTADVIGREGSRIQHRVRCSGPNGDAIIGRASVAEK